MRTLDTTGPPHRGTAHPFTTAWPIFDELEINFGDSGDDVDAVLAFVSRVESQFYPMFGVRYYEQIVEWAKSRHDNSELDEADA